MLCGSMWTWRRSTGGHTPTYPFSSVKREGGEERERQSSQYLPHLLPALPSSFPAQVSNTRPSLSDDRRKFSWIDLGRNLNWVQPICSKGSRYCPIVADNAYCWFDWAESIHWKVSSSILRRKRIDSKFCTKTCCLRAKNRFPIIKSFYTNTTCAQKRVLLWYDDESMMQF